MEIYTGKTVEEALEKASQELNTPVSELIYLDTGKKTGLFSKKVQIEVYDIKDVVRFAEDYILYATDALGIESICPYHLSAFRYNNSFLTPEESYDLPSVHRI